MLLEEIIPPLPDTPCNSPAGKLRTTDKVDAASISTQLSELSELVKNRSDGLEKLIGENLRMIKDMKEEIGRNTAQISGVMETIEFICSEVKDLKERVDLIDSRTKKEEIISIEQEKRLAHLEAYTRRWNLRVQRKKEKMPVRKLSNKGRGIIFQFTSRFYRDAVWRAAKDADFLTENCLKITEDLSPADRARRSKLWPAVEKARNKNKRAFFVGGRAFVDGANNFNSQVQ
ncbi:Anaphase spindle elongation protein 1 [Labeo rohita]|uniref:Anaphase spindle elongation protein 1 n=1 Tax=Labeo rohita TaxID=84645 RepID=A0ABQ8L7K6_LABRO|nr:Anaphase spindle elongation protein 1 [Labeo rohita]